MIFGKPGGPARLVLTIVALGVILLLTVTVARLNTRLATQEAANQETLQVSGAIVEVNDKVTERLAQLTKLTRTADKALGETKALEPLLLRLRDAIGPAAVAIQGGSRGAQLSEAQLLEIEAIVGRIEGRVAALVKDAQSFGREGRELLAVVRQLVGDVRASLEAARRINKRLPG